MFDVRLKMNTQKEYITQIELAKKSGKKRQWINYLISKNRLNTEMILGRTVIINDQNSHTHIKKHLFMVWLIRSLRK